MIYIYDVIGLLQFGKFWVCLNMHCVGDGRCKARPSIDNYDKDGGPEEV